jgi:hypothetical protein
MAAITSIKNQLDAMEQKLLSGTPLPDAEQSFYDSVSSSDLEEKENYVKDLMHQQVDDGLITGPEKTQLLSQVNERLQTIQKELADTENETKPKKVEKLNSMKGKVETRKEKLSKIAPRQPHRLKHEAGIFKLRAELQPLLELEDGAKGRLLSLKETQSLARKEEILEDIGQLEVRITRLDCVPGVVPVLRNHCLAHFCRKTAEDGLRMTRLLHCGWRHAIQHGRPKVNKRRKRQKRLLPPPRVPGKRQLPSPPPGQTQSLLSRRKPLVEVVEYSPQ